MEKVQQHPICLVIDMLMIWTAHFADFFAAATALLNVSITGKGGNSVPLVKVFT